MCNCVVVAQPFTRQVSDGRSDKAQHSPVVVAEFVGENREKRVVGVGVQAPTPTR